VRAGQRDLRWPERSGLDHRDEGNAVIFDLFNEPYPDRALPSETAAWQCWLKGGSSCTAGISYPVAGMQTLVNTVRATGASNVIMLGGLAYANDLSQWLTYRPTDPDGNLAAAWNADFNCSTGLGLITGYTGTPTGYGAGYEAHLKSLAGL
jgi:hypothetical protein